MDIKVDKRTVIVFDLDDTLYNEIDYLRSAYVAIAKGIIPQNWQSLFARMFSMYRNKENVFEYLSTTYNVDKKKLIDEYRNHSPSIETFKGVIPLIENIKKNDGKLGLITDGRSHTQRAKLKALNIEHYFDKIIISEELGSEKPNENNFLAIEHSFKNCSFCYIADNVRKDFIAPNNLGWYSIGLIDNGLNIHSDSYLYFDDKYLPKTFVEKIGDITVV